MLKQINSVSCWYRKLAHHAIKQEYNNCHIITQYTFVIHLSKPSDLSICNNDIKIKQTLKRSSAFIYLRIYLFAIIYNNVSLTGKSVVKLLNVRSPMYARSI